MSNTEKRQYFAHSDPKGQSPQTPGARWQLLKDHLQQVGSSAARFAVEASHSPNFAARARAIGLLHDLGKYRDEFQKLLRGEVAKAPHSIYGAAAAYGQAHALDAAFTIAGHHAGMPDSSDLLSRLKEVEPELAALWKRAVDDCPELADCFRAVEPLLGPLGKTDAGEFDLDCRMLLSCLVDADRTDTAQHAEGEAMPASPPLDAARRLASLLSATGQRAGKMEDGPVRQARQAVLQACLAGAERPARVFSLTVPTGGGKTLSSMAFALRRAQLRPEETRRIIVVIPFLSIIEQNARIYHDVLGPGVLEHHSGIIGQEERTAGDGYDALTRRAAWENWDAPIVVTTSVRFFETLFSNHPRDLRRLHNIARSVVILDEVQTLPRRFVKPVLAMLGDLAQRWHTTFVLSTATQPALEKPGNAPREDERWPEGTVEEIIPQPKELFASLRRVRTEWRTDPLEWSAIAADLAREPQALAIVNTRAQAVSLAEALAASGEAPFHLSTNLCPQHRLQRLAQIRRRMADAQPCRVVATQLVEAGVDLDFPVVWRAMGPLDSIAQAAGRCDREGKLTALRGGEPGGRLVVFQPAEGKMPPGVYEEGAGITAAWARGGPVEWDDPGTIRRYFDRLFQGPLDAEEVELLRQSRRFKQVAEAVRWTADVTQAVIVPYNDEARAVIDEFRHAGPTLGRFRRAQQFTVNLWPSEFTWAKAIGSVKEVQPGVWVVAEGLYDEQYGIRLEGARDLTV